METCNFTYTAILAITSSSFVFSEKKKILIRSHILTYYLTFTPATCESDFIFEKDGTAF